MSLPLTTIPSGSVSLPVLKKKVRVRAMNIGEEKILLTSKDAGNTDDILFSIKELIKECTYGKIDFDVLTVPDLTAIFVKIIELSKGTTCVHNYICHNKIKDDDGTEHECKTHIPVEVDLKNIKYTGGDAPNTIQLPENIVLTLKYPTTEIYKSAFEDSKHDGIVNETEAQLRVYAYCISSVMQGENLYTEYTRDEIYTWMLELHETALKQFAAFFDSVPNAVLTYEVKCPKCGYSEIIELKGLDDFFMQDIPENRY